jgi:hypothetical protein
MIVGGMLRAIMQPITACATRTSCGATRMPAPASNRDRDRRDHWPQQKCGWQPHGLQAKCEEARQDVENRPLLGDGLAAKGSMELQTDSTMVLRR